MTSRKSSSVPKPSTSSVLQEGSRVPRFTCLDGDGKPFNEKDLVAERTVLYFYPKDDTSGCTAQACAFRDGYRQILKKGVRLLGVSPDSVASHAKFRQKHDLPFPLLSDPDKSLCQAFGVWVQKSLYGRKYMGVERTTFIIGGDGRIEKVFPKVKVAGHFDEVLAALGS